MPVPLHKFKESIDVKNYSMLAAIDLIAEGKWTTMEIINKITALRAEKGRPAKPSDRRHDLKWLERIGFARTTSEGVLERNPEFKPRQP